ncbi:thioredoxin reductase 1, cytoplasmic, putative [Acanthamoeba castellanii str. Neff]|uniref:thioredoxin-disulfide reductase (NADPH) n=1 Tax=Acanthamoeba castellanii (strain ATCC 30010 / Neff) TaxID=1257118 RepID=L8HG59_ACACF|nr:thioredoxin reductase 1, cytoplasmic, putative [Acanthamoeba castellanii str. Neff]ELR24105.1 thioredoxin reductase 1, cytoplasmic, putative [Acanthamoeba castellanii str. Neff]
MEAEHKIISNNPVADGVPSPTKEVTMADARLVDAEEPEDHTYDYDLIVIGGGSGGLAAAKEAGRLGKKVALLDFVVPTPTGTTWGLGGTCVNVGCIPKKLMHQAALLGESLKDAQHYGWAVPDNVNHDWEKMVNAVQDHIGSLNWGYRVALREKNVNYLNAYGVFVDSHTLECTDRAKKVTRVTARRFLVATGGRPKYPDIPGDREFGITSDDFFSLPTPPGKTLVVGASYVALECAGFVRGLGYDTTVMVRSILLRGFDQQLANMIGQYMECHGIKFVRSAVPTKVEKLESGKLRVTFQQDGVEGVEEYDTVMWAIGREAETKKIGLDKAGVQVDRIGKIHTVMERTNVPHIYAIGDIIVDEPSQRSLELTPVAIKAGILLVRRLYAGSTQPMDYINVPTTVFTPIEYGAIGYSEEDAIAQFGEDNLEIYHSYFKPLEWTIAERDDNVCYAKLICDKRDSERVVGFHVLGPNAGEITQGFGTAMKAGATKSTFDATVGIHPTTAEEFTTLEVTKRSGVEAQKKGC